MVCPRCEGRGWILVTDISADPELRRFNGTRKEDCIYCPDES